MHNMDDSSIHGLFWVRQQPKDSSFIYVAAQYPSREWKKKSSAAN